MRFAHRRRLDAKRKPRGAGAKSCGSLLLRSHWLPQPAARAAAFCDDASGNGGLAYVRKFPRFHPRKDIRPFARNAVDQILAAVAALHPELRRQLLAAAGAGRLPMVLERYGGQ